MTRETTETMSTTIVRRFTGQLDGTTDLERATISALEKQDAEEELAHDNRLRSYFEDTAENSSALDFRAADIARNSLQKVCKEMAKEVKPSRLGKIGSLFGKQRKSAKQQANEAMESFIVQDFDDLKLFVENQEAQWKSSHGKIYENFQRLCRNVDSHKRVFEIFPQQNMYTSVFCGSLSLIVQASVNHDQIAETLSKTVTEIAIESSYCMELIDVIRTPAMREQLAKVYELMFRFYRDVIEWYLRSSKSRFFGSFNETIKSNFEDAAKGIRDTISYMFNRSLPVGTAAMVKMMQRDVAFSKAELLRQRQSQWDRYGSSTDPGEFMQAVLKAMATYQVQAIEDASPMQILAQPEEAIIESTPKRDNGTSRAELYEQAQNLEKLVVGDEGHALFERGQFWMPDTKVTPVLQNWMAGSEAPRTLWISGPATHDSTTSAQAAALNVVFAAWRVSAPILSHFCLRPRSGVEGLTCEQSGLIGLLYSFILQLLQFKVEDDDLDLSLEDLKNLEGHSASFPRGLDILYRLLVCTPHIKFCVIHDLNTLEWGGGSEWCHDFLDVLFRAQAQSQGSFKILLTTSGSSRVLSERIPAKSQCFAEKGARQLPLPTKSFRSPSEN